jgi:DNA polymerase-3 subunit alpha
VHIAGYTLILMIEMNICYRYGSIYWKTACLSINAGLIGDEASGTDYGEIAKAIGDMKGTIIPPDINKSNLEFVPLEKENKILFGLKPIPGLGLDAIETIIKNRPYKSFDDFYNRIIKTGLISDKKGVILIKAGCFDCFNKDRRALMIEYVRRVAPKKEKLTMTQFPAIMSKIDQEKYKKELEIYQFRNKCFGRNKVPMNEELESEFIIKYSDKVEYSFVNGNLVIDQKSFDKFYQKAIKPLKEWIATEEALNEYNKLMMREYWKENCMGSVESWEMETILFYSNRHELDYMPIKKYFDIVSFNDLPPVPEVVGYRKYKGKQYPQYKISVIAGTVVDKKKEKSLVYVLTQDGVVTVRYYKGSFAYYNKKVVRVNGKNKEILDPSWFERGTKLVLVGYRRGEEFVLNTSGSQYQHTTIKINGYNKEQLYLQTRKVEE